jgi:uncharacterized protein YndB with AHSA1/START domain
MSKRRHELAVDMAATPEQIWRMLTEAEGIQKWFAPEARVTPGAGGSITLSWGEGCEGTAPIHLWEPGKRLGWTEGAKFVEFEIEAIGGGSTRLRLVHSGFEEGAAFDQEYDSTQGGWQTFMAMLKHSVEHYAAAPATHVHLLRIIPATSQLEQWDKLIGPDGVAIDSLTEGRPYRARLGEEALAGTVIRYVRPGYLCLSADHSIVGLFTEKSGSGSMVTLQWILFGDGRGRAAQVRQALTDVMDWVAPRAPGEAEAVAAGQKQS